MRYGDGIVSGSLDISSIEPVAFRNGNILELATAARRYTAPEPAAAQPSTARTKRGTNSA